MNKQEAEELLKPLFDAIEQKSEFVVSKEFSEMDRDNYKRAFQLSYMKSIIVGMATSFNEEQLAYYKNVFEMHIKLNEAEDK